MSAPNAPAVHGEHWTTGCQLTIQVKRCLYHAQSAFQKIEIVETEAFGRMLVLDGIIMTTEFDEFIYHEMLVHPALQLIGVPQSVLIIGGGDGGAAREVLRYPSVERLELVEIDGMVVDAAKRFLPEMAQSFDDPRLKLHLADGTEFVKSAEGPYDAIIVDASDPLEFAEGLFTPVFYRDCSTLLSARGVLVVQSESPLDPKFRRYTRSVRRYLQTLFPIAESYLATIPSYPYALWSFTMGSRALHPVNDDALTRSAAVLSALRYYTPALHRAAFSLPSFVRHHLS
jgi:spermidine synthase